MKVSEDAGNHYETVILDTNAIQEMDTNWFQRNLNALEVCSVESVFDSILSMSGMEMNSVSALTKSVVVMTVFYMYQLLSYGWLWLCIL